jgi:hypothetical protein
MRQKKQQPPSPIEVKVIDVIGSVSNEEFCYMVCSVSGKVFPLLCTRGEGESCRAMLGGESKRRGPFGFLADLMRSFKTKLEKAELQMVNGAIYGKLYFTDPVIQRKDPQTPIRISLTEPGIVIDTAMSMGVPVIADKAFVDSINDGSGEYRVLKSSHSQLWPKPDMGSTRSLQTISDFLDKAK